MMTVSIGAILDVADLHSHFTTRRSAGSGFAAMTCDECGWEVKPGSGNSTHESPYYRHFMTRRQHQVHQVEKAFPGLEDLLS